MIKSFSGNYDFLDNSYPHSFTVDDIRYPTVENWILAWKCKTQEEFISIATEKDLSIARRKSHTASLRPDWLRIRIAVMHDGLTHKFEDPLLKRQLLGTGEEELVYENTKHDNFWGKCVCKKCKNKHSENALGKILMDLRHELKDKEEQANSGDEPHYKKQKQDNKNYFKFGYNFS